MIFAPFAYKQQVVSAPAPSGFTPNDITDLTFWVDMSDSNFYTVTGGTVITEIYSKVGGTTNTTLTRVNTSNNHYQLAASLSNSSLNSAKVTTRPTTYRSSTWNNGVAADATFGPKTNTTDYPDGTMFVITNRGTISSAGYVVSRYNGTTDRGVIYDLNSTGIPNTQIIGYDYNSPTYQYYNTYSYPNNILTRVNNGATSTIYRNGALQESGSKNDTQNLSTRQFHNLGIYGSPTGTGDSTPVNTQYCEIIIYNRVLSNSEINQVTSYLSNKWTIPVLSITNDSFLTYLESNNTLSYPGSGTIWYDLSGKGNNGTLTNGPTFTSASPSYFTFDGTNDYVSLPSGTYGAETGSYTFGGWFNTATLPNAYKMIYSRGQDGVGSGWSLQIRLNSANKIEACVVAKASGGSFVEYDATAPSACSANTWYNVYGVWTSSTDIKLYINGSLITTVSASGKSILRDSTVNWSVSWNYSPYQYAGKVSNFLLYNRVLTDTEILNNYNAQKSIYGY